MRSLVGLLCVLGLLHGGRAADDGDIFAVLVAGSNGYWNYRHQADVFHAYHVLRNHGVKADNIIVLAYDDVARDEENPFPGKVFNAPNGKDVYAGVKIDYKGEDVTPENFLAILQGNSTGVKGGNGRVLTSGPKDRVMINFADHGAPGLIGFPWSELTVKDFNATLQAMHDKKMYKEMVIYLEACESGSMFEGILPDNVGILAITAANPDESSWGCYCDDLVMNTCLGDLFSVNWMEDSDVNDLNKETLHKQYLVVKKKTNKSNVMQYGNTSIGWEMVADFQGHVKSRHAPLHMGHNLEMQNNSVGGNVTWGNAVNVTFGNGVNVTFGNGVNVTFGNGVNATWGNGVNATWRSGGNVTWETRQIPLKTLESQLRHTTDLTKRIKLASKITMMKSKQRYLDEHTRALISKIIPDASAHREVMTSKPRAITAVDCHHEVVKMYSKQCFNLGQNSYALKAVAPLTNLCERGVEVHRIVETIKLHCAGKDHRMTNIN